MGSFLPSFHIDIFVFVVEQPSVSNCTSENYTLLTSPTGYISNTVTKDTQCGSLASPWILRALPGQRFNISLLDFTDRDHAAQSGCYRYALIYDVLNAKRTTVCGGMGGDKHIYSSMGNVIRIGIMNGGLARKPFLLKYQGMFLLQIIILL